MTGTALQYAIFEAIKNQLPNGHSLVDVLKPILKRTKNVIYKRINGTAPLTLDDICLLSEHFHLPFEKILQHKPTSFLSDFSGFGAQTSSLQYLDILETELAALKDEKDVNIWYITTGLPDFYFFYFESLTLFKSYIWERMVWENEGWQKRNFKLDIPEKEGILKKAGQLANYYSYIETTEIWNEHVLSSLMHQLLYVVESRLYDDKDDILTVCGDIKKLIDHLAEMAYAEKHFTPLGHPPSTAASFKLYQNRTMQNNIFLFMENGGRKEVYTVLNTPNFIKITDPQIISYMSDITQRIFKRAEPLGQNGEKNRRVYFDKLHSVLKLYTTEITGIVGKKSSILV